MPADLRTTPEPLTRNKWTELLSHFGQREWASRRHPRQRRGQQRYHIPAIASLTPQPADGQPARVHPGCPVLEVSASGLAVRSFQKIAIGTAVHLEVSICDKRLVLSGRVANCSGFPGRYRIGLTLDFTD